MTAYAAPADVRAVLNPDYVAGQAAAAGPARDASSLSDAQLAACIARAQARVDSYVGARYQTPVDAAKVPGTLVQDLTVDLAAYFATLIYLRRDALAQDEPVALRFADAMRNLVAVRDGKAVLPLPQATTGDALDSSGGYAGVVDVGTGGLFDQTDIGSHRSRYGVRSGDILQDESGLPWWGR